MPPIALAMRRLNRKGVLAPGLGSGSRSGRCPSALPPSSPCWEGSSRVWLGRSRNGTAPRRLASAPWRCRWPSALPRGRFRRRTWTCSCAGSPVLDPIVGRDSAEGVRPFLLSLSPCDRWAGIRDSSGDSRRAPLMPWRWAARAAAGPRRRPRRRLSGGLGLPLDCNPGRAYSFTPRTRCVQPSLVSVPSNSFPLWPSGK